MTQSSAKNNWFKQGSPQLAATPNNRLDCSDCVTWLDSPAQRRKIYAEIGSPWLNSLLELKKPFGEPSIKTKYVAVEIHTEPNWSSSHQSLLPASSFLEKTTQHVCKALLIIIKKKKIIIIIIIICNYYYKHSEFVDRVLSQYIEFI